MLIATNGKYLRPESYLAFKKEIEKAKKKFVFSDSSDYIVIDKEDYTLIGMVDRHGNMSWFYVGLQYEVVLATSFKSNPLAAIRGIAMLGGDVRRLAYTTLN